MATTTMAAARDGRVGRAATRCIAAAFFALLVLGATMGTAGAEYPTMGTQHQFVVRCKNEGGTPKREGTHIVSCTNGDITETCNFNTNTCVTAFTQPTEDTSPSLEDGVLAQDPSATSDPAAGGTWVAESGTWTVLAVEDDEQP